MNPSVFLEKNISQQPALELLQAMGYTYIAPADCGPAGEPVSGAAKGYSSRAAAAAQPL